MKTSLFSRTLIVAFLLTSLPSQINAQTQRKQAASTERVGTFSGSKLTATRSAAAWMVLVEPGLLDDDKTIIAVSRYVLSEFVGVNMKNVGAPREAGKFLRFNAADGAYDVLITRDTKTQKLIGLAVRGVK